FRRAGTQWRAGGGACRGCRGARWWQPWQQGRGSRIGGVGNDQSAGAAAMNKNTQGRPSGKPVRRDGVDPVLRSRARRRAVQAIYAWQISGGNAQSLIAQFAHEQAREIADLAYFEALVQGVLDNRRDLDEALVPYLDRGIEDVDA